MVSGDMFEIIFMVGGFELVCRQRVIINMIIAISRNSYNPNDQNSGHIIQ